MRRTLIAVAMTLFVSQAFAAPRASTSWIKRADAATTGFKIASNASLLADTDGSPRPIVLLETNYYALVPGEPLQLRLSTYSNGFGGAATMYLYWENRTTGERRYYNIPGGGLLAAGTTADLFGSAGTPVPVFVPELTDLVLLGSTGTSPLSWNAAGVLGPETIVPSGQTGLYQYVVEIRDAAGKRVLSRSNAMYSYVTESVTVSGTITQSTTWTADKRYVLNEFVGVASPALLTIEPGTTVYGGSSRATLFVRRGAKIVADGTARRPIIFTSPKVAGSRAMRDWGSLVLLGNAPINEPLGSARSFLEGLPQTPEYSFGGSDPNDSSGVLRYVRLEFGGFEIETNQEINGLSMAGIGSGTVIDYVQVLFNKDDGFEFWGGTVNAKHLLAVGHADDGLDFDLGYQGNIQFAAIIKRHQSESGEPDPNVLIESDGHPQNFTATPMTNPRVYNITGFGSGVTTASYGMVFRRGSAGQIRNAVVLGPTRTPITLRDDATLANAGSGALTVDSSILFGSFEDANFASSSDKKNETRTFALSSMKNNRNVDPLLSNGTYSHIRTLMPDLSPKPGSPALDINYVATPPDNGFFEQVDFVGAVGPHDNWVLSGWASFSDN